MEENGAESDGIVYPPSPLNHGHARKETSYHAATLTYLLSALGHYFFISWFTDFLAGKTGRSEKKKKNSK